MANDMTNRRQFLAATTCAAAFTRVPELFAADTKFDLVIKGGRVIDPSRKLDAMRDVAIAQGKIQPNGRVKIVQPVETGKVRAEGALIHRGRTVATAEGKLVDAEGKLYAHATTTCMIFPAKS